MKSFWLWLGYVCFGPNELKSRKPACASWDVWTGEEVEGTSDLGRTTLFIRRMSGIKFVSLVAADWTVTRIWFCKEFRKWDVIREALACGYTVCVEGNPHRPPPSDICNRVHVYWKYPLPKDAKSGDHVCMGPPFRDEAFVLGNGKRVTENDYAKDRKWV